MSLALPARQGCIEPEGQPFHCRRSLCVRHPGPRNQRFSAPMMFQPTPCPPPRWPEMYPAPQGHVNAPRKCRALAFGDAGHSKRRPVMALCGSCGWFAGAPWRRGFRGSRFCCFAWGSIPLGACGFSRVGRCFVFALAGVSPQCPRFVLRSRRSGRVVLVVFAPGPAAAARVAGVFCSWLRVPRSRFRLCRGR